jgi:hypothetical protein
MVVKRVVVILGVIANGGVGFYIFGQAFNGYPVSLSTQLILLACVGVPLGILSGVVFKSCPPQAVFLSMFPILGFFGLFVGGAVEKGTAEDVAISVCRFFVPLLIQGGLWFVSAKFAARRAG